MRILALHACVALGMMLGGCLGTGSNLEVRAWNQTDSWINGTVVVHYVSPGGSSFEETVAISIPPHQFAGVYENQRVTGRGDLMVAVHLENGTYADHLWPQLVPGQDENTFFVNFRSDGVTFGAAFAD